MTAVEWLENEIEMRYGLTPTSILLFRYAKELEKQQIIEFTSDFIDEYTYGDYDGDVQKSKTIEEYYNEKFKNK